MFQSNLGTAAIIGELLNRGVSFWDAPQQLVLITFDTDVIADVAAAKLDALVGSTRSLSEMRTPYRLPAPHLFSRSFSFTVLNSPLGGIASN